MMTEKLICEYCKKSIFSKEELSIGVDQSVFSKRLYPLHAKCVQTLNEKKENFFNQKSIRFDNIETMKKIDYNSINRIIKFAFISVLLVFLLFSIMSFIIQTLSIMIITSIIGIIGIFVLIYMNISRLKVNFTKEEMLKIEAMYK